MTHTKGGAALLGEETREMRATELQCFNTQHDVSISLLLKGCVLYGGL